MIYGRAFQRNMGVQNQERNGRAATNKQTGSLPEKTGQTDRQAESGDSTCYEAIGWQKTVKHVFEDEGEPVHQARVDGPAQLDFAQRWIVKVPTKRLNARRWTERRGQRRVRKDKKLRLLSIKRGRIGEIR